MPGLINDAGLCGFSVGIAENKAIFPAMLHQPFLGGGVFLIFVQIGITAVDQVHGQTQLMLAGAGGGDDLSGFLPGFLSVVTLLYKIIHLLVKEGFLGGLPTIGGYDPDLVTCFFAGAQHFQQRVYAALIQGVAFVVLGVIIECDQIGTVIIGHEMPGIHHKDLLAGLGKKVVNAVDHHFAPGIRAISFDVVGLTVFYHQPVFRLRGDRRGCLGGGRRFCGGRRGCFGGRGSLRRCRDFGRRSGFCRDRNLGGCGACPGGFRLGCGGRSAADQQTDDRQQNKKAFHKRNL